MIIAEFEAEFSNDFWPRAGAEVGLKKDLTRLSWNTEAVGTVSGELSGGIYDLSRDPILCIHQLLCILRTRSES